jgi:hypothetical protein
LGNVCVDERIILKWLLKIHDLRCGLDVSSSGCGPVAALVTTVMSLWVPQKTSNFLAGCATVSFSRMSLPPVVTYFGISFGLMV